MPIYSPLDTELTVADDYPVNTHLCFGIGSSHNIIYVSNADRTKVYHLNVSTGTRTQLDVDPSNTSGDQKSRDHDIREAFHDRANSIIYFIDCDQPGDDFDVWKLDYSGSETSPSVTEVGTSSTYESGTVNVHDIIRYSVSTYALVSYENPAGTLNSDLFDVTSSPFSIQKALASTSYKDFLPFVLNGANIYGFFSNDAEIISTNDIGALGGNDNPWGIVWDGTNWFVTDFTDAYVYKYNSDFSVLVTSYDVGALGGNDIPHGIEWDGANFWIIDNDRYVYKYPADFSSLTTSIDLTDLASDTPTDLCWDGTNWFVSGNITVHKYNSDFSSHITSYNLGAHVAIIYGITWDGSNFYVLGFDGAAHPYIFKYDASFSFITSYDLQAIGINFPLGADYDGSDFFLVNTHYVIDIHERRTTFIEYNFTSDVVSTTTISNTTEIKTGNQRAIAWDGNDTLYIVLEDYDSITYLYSYVISTSTLTQRGEFNVALMLDRNTNSSADPPFNLEKGFGIESGVNDLQIFQIPSTLIGFLNKIGDLSNVAALSGYSIKAITDHFIFLST